MTSTRLTFVRHAHAHSNAAGVISGVRTCAGLTELGMRQAGALGRRLRVDGVGDPVTVIYSTRLRRAEETAAVAGEALGLAVNHMDCLRYPDYGSAEGREWRSVYDEFDGIHPAMYPHRELAPGAEPSAVFRESMRESLDRLVDRHRGGHVLVFCSTENILAAAELAQGLPADARARSKFAADHTALTVWDVKPASWAPDGRWTLVRHNDASHLPIDQQRSKFRESPTLGS